MSQQISSFEVIKSLAISKTALIGGEKNFKLSYKSAGSLSNAFIWIADICKKRNWVLGQSVKKELV